MWMTYAAGLSLSVLFFFSTVIAAEFSFQPRLEVGVMQYAFESGSIGATIPSESVNSGFNFSQQAFEYSDTLLVYGGGCTFFMGHFFLDFNGQFAVNGDDSAMASFSGFSSATEMEGTYTAYFAADPLYEVSFDRTDIAASIGYAFSRHFSIFAGYKRAKTEFDATYQGPFSMVVYDDGGTIPFDSIGGRIWGDAKFNFEYEGPFVGAIHGWDFGQDYYFRGVFTASLAIAYLDGKVEVEQRTTNLALSWIDDQQLPDTAMDSMDRGFANRLDTTGEALGYTIGIGWRGTTAVEGLTYSLNVSGYRYEFDTDDRAQSDINETAVVYKAGLSYAY